MRQVANELTLGHVGITHARGEDSRAYLQLWTPAGRDRLRVDLMEDDLICLIAEASRVLAILKGVRV